MDCRGAQEVRRGENWLFFDVKHKIQHGKFITDIRRRTISSAGIVATTQAGSGSMLDQQPEVLPAGGDHFSVIPEGFCDVDDAENLAKKLGIGSELVNIQPIADSLFKSLHISEKDSEQKIPKANVYARIRMIILYFNANVNNYLVAGTGDRSESLIGYFTKYGDGGVDFSPIVHLYKTEVRQLARHLGIPKKIADKPSSPQLYPGQKATDQIPLDYKDLDPLIAGLFDSKSSVKEVGSLADFPSEKIAEVLRLFDLSKHKRTMPPMIVDPRIIREK